MWDAVIYVHSIYWPTSEIWPTFSAKLSSLLFFWFSYFIFIYLLIFFQSSFPVRRCPALTASHRQKLEMLLCFCPRGWIHIHVVDLPAPALKPSACELCCDRWKTCSVTVSGIRFPVCRMHCGKFQRHEGPLPSLQHSHPPSLLLVSSCLDPPCFTAAEEEEEEGEWRMFSQEVLAVSHCCFLSFSFISCSSFWV